MADACVTYEIEPSLRPGFQLVRRGENNRREYRRCLTDASGHTYWNAHCVQIVPPGEKAWREATVYVVRIPPELRERWPYQPISFFLVAQHDGAATAYLGKRFGHIAERSAGMAQHVLGLAMKSISTRPPAKPRALGANAARRAKDFMEIRVSDGGNTYTVQVKSNLSYAIDAVNGGMAGVNDALKRAANRISGMIRNRAGARLDENLSTPFPEVKRK